MQASFSETSSRTVSDDVVRECSSHLCLGHHADQLVSVDDRQPAYLGHKRSSLPSRSLYLVIGQRPPRARLKDLQRRRKESTVYR